MVATLQSRKEALEAKILEKNEELKKLCLQEADLTGIIPPEIPLEPGEPPPPIRRRVGTSFSFPQNLINNVKDADEDALTALELECKVQTNIAEAALALANDSSATKAARRKHRLMYRQSQRRLLELEARLNLLKQGKSQQLKPQQIKKKPRPNTTAVENLNFLWNKTSQSGSLGSWPGKLKSDQGDEIDGSIDLGLQSDSFGSLHRSYKSSCTSQSSGSLKTDVDNDGASLNKPFPNHYITGYMTHSDHDNNKICPNPQHHKRTSKRELVRRQWDTQSARGTLLPSQMYPDHSHQPNLSRTQSLGSMESNPQKSKDSWSMQDFMYEGNTSQEKEWYETSLDSTPSPPLRTTSRLPPSARMLFNMQETVPTSENWGGGNLQPSTSHPALPTTPNLSHKTVTRSSSAFPATDSAISGVENLTNCLQQINLNLNIKGNLHPYLDDVGVPTQKEFFYDIESCESRKSIDLLAAIPKVTHEEAHYQISNKPKLETAYINTSNDARILQNCENIPGLSLVRQDSLNLPKYNSSSSGSELGTKAQENKATNSLYMNVLESNSELDGNNWLSGEECITPRRGGQIAVPQEYASKIQTPTQPYYHTTKNSSGEKIKTLQYQAARNRHASITEEQRNFQIPSPIHNVVHHPPHAITQNEISFDTVVPFESPQNHTVVQAGKWQPYREVTKPFEMSDFYKYSTKFRQSKAAQGNHPLTPDASRNSPQHQKGIYTPLKPMTCQPVESRTLMQNQGEPMCDEVEKTLVEVSPPEIV